MRGEAAWEPRAEQEVNTDSLREPGKAMRNCNERGPAKRVKREEQGVVWGEDAMERDNAKMELLMEQSMPVAKTEQTSIKVYSGVEWVMRELLRECTHRAVELADLTEGADEWEEWESMASHSTSLAPGLDVTTQLSKRTEKRKSFCGQC